ncbi:MAG: MFS transporter [Candidatus Thermoplasmatota archaeon]|nr:MFS transporter [Candidatus Thermoplasmatota archaeon]MCL5665301.1 MFS transporter [Candidatus Thermoplasmatota archaeon]
MDDRQTDGGINPFISNLSSLNLLFSLSMTIFSFTLIIFIEENAINVIYGGIGLSIGEIIMIFTLIPQGRLIDKGHSFSLMVIGSLLYGILIIFLFFIVTARLYYFVLVPMSVALIIVSQGMFRSSMNSFIAKAISFKIIGKNYARIITMETIGTAIGFAIFSFGSYYSILGLIYLGAGILLSVMSVLIFMVLQAKQRELMKSEEGKTPRPGFRESFSRLRGKMDFIAPLVSSKVFMNIGVIAYTFFYIPTGLSIGIPVFYSSIFLLSSYVLGIVWGKIGEKFIDNHRSFGRKFVSLAMMIDIFTFGLILFSVYYHNFYTFAAAALFASPGTLLISGALSYEASVIGREDRGIFSSVQRLSVGIVAIFMTIILTYLYEYHFQILWFVVFGSACMSFLLSFTIPAKYSSSLAVNAS